MQRLFVKFSNFCMNLSGIMLDNGAGRVTRVQETTGPSDPSGFSTFISGIISAISEALINLGEFILRCLARIAYFVFKICLNIMDFMNIVIKELSGQATNYSIKGNSNLAESDILFQFLFNELTLKIFKAVLIFSFLLLIVFTIMAIVKQEWQNHITGKQNSIKKIFRKVFISLFTMLIIPFVLVIGIVFSNVLLASAMSALTGQNGSFSIGAQIYAASSYDANRFREYAVDGKKIPIVFDYDGGFENSVTTELPDITEDSSSMQEQQIKEIIESGNFTTGQSAYNMFKEENFYTFDSIPDDSYYYSVYDGNYLKTKQVEYYVMADFLDFAMSSGGIFYLTNAEKAFMSVMNYIAVNGIPSKDEDEFMHDAIWGVLDNLVAYNEKNEVIVGLANTLTIKEKAEAITSGTIAVDHVAFNVYYNKSRAEVLHTSEMDGDGVVNYNSIAGSTDEVTGAKYIFCHRVENADGDFFYLPIRLGDEVNGIEFTSNFLASAPLAAGGHGTLRSETPFIARGVFTVSGYPTAIREDGNNVVYYRQDPVSPSALNYSEIFNYQAIGGADSEPAKNSLVGGLKNLLGEWLDPSNLIEFFTGVDISTLAPDIQVNLNFFRLFTKSEVVATTLDGGKFTVNYSFVGSGLRMPNLYDELQINYVVLLFACVSLFMSLFYIIWGLVQRLFEITLLWVTFPGWVSKFPLEKSDNIGDTKTSFREWKDRMIERVLALYSIYLSLALILMLIPIVFKMDFITTFDIEETNIFSIFNADVANLVIKTAFVLVLFNFLNISRGDGNSAPRIIEDMLLRSKMDPRKGYLVQVGADAVKEAKNLGNKAVSFFTISGLVKTTKGAALNAARTGLNAIPGAAIAHKVSDGINKATFLKKNDAMLKSNQNALLSKDNESDIKSAAGELNKATSDHTFLEGYKQAQSDYWRKTGDGLKKDFRKNRGKVSGMNERLYNIAKSGGGAKIKVGRRKVTERSEFRRIRRNRGI